MLDNSHLQVSSAKLFIRWALLVVVLLSAGLLWKYSDLRSYLSPQSLEAIAQYLSSFSFPLGMIVLAFLIASIVLFPISAMVIITGLALPPLQAILAGCLGVMAASTIGYSIGWFLGPEWAERNFGRIYDSASKLVKKNILVSIMIVRHLPLGPFSFVNIVLGSMRLPILSFLLGNAVSLLPTLLLTVIFKTGLTFFT